LNLTVLPSFPSYLMPNFLAYFKFPVFSRSILTIKKMFLLILLMLPQSFVVCDAVHREIWHKLLAYISHFQSVNTVNYRLRPPATVYSTAFTCPQGQVMRSKPVKYRRSLRTCREFCLKKNEDRINVSTILV
jgi:hypothetical protein